MRRRRTGLAPSLLRHSFATMIPLSDGIPARRFPIVTLALIAANLAVWIFYELPHLDSSVFHASFYLAGGFVATMTQTLMTLLAGTAADARVPTLGASGAIAAVLGAYFVLYPH